MGATQINNLLSDRFGVARTPAAVAAALVRYFGVRSDGKPTTQNYRLRLPDDYVPAKQKLQRQRRAETAVRPTPLVPPQPHIDLSPPPAAGKLEVTVAGPRGRIRVETARSLTNVLAFLTGVGS